MYCNGTVKPCEYHEPGPNVEMKINLTYIFNLGDVLYEDILSEGDCFWLIVKRIYGSLQFSTELVENADAIQDFLARLEGDTMKRMEYARGVKAAFVDGFASCSDSTCVSEKLCGGISNQLQKS